MTDTNLSPMNGRTTVNLKDNNDAWAFALDAVDYPIYIKPLFFRHDGDELRAEGITNTGRDSQFFGVVVDRNRTGELSTISTVTNTYGSVPPCEVYDSLRKEFDELGIDNQPVDIYVSGDGGRQILSIEIKNQKSPNCKSDIGMMVQLVTSIDGTKKHTMRLVAYDHTNQAEFVGLTNEQFNVATRHTQAIKERTIVFENIITKLTKEWNDTIMPMMALMMDAKFDRETAVKLLEKLMQDSKIPERHQKKATDSYYTQMADASHEHSVYTVMSGVSRYLSEEMADKPERAEEFREKLNKRSQKVINKTLMDLGLQTI